MEDRNLWAKDACLYQSENEESKSESYEYGQEETDTENEIDDEETLLEVEDGNESNFKGKKHLTNEERMDIQAELLIASTDNALKHGTMSKIAKKYDRDRATIKRIWDRHLEDVAKTGKSRGNVSSRMKGRCGRKPLDKEEVYKQILLIPHRQRQNLRALSAASGYSPSYLAKILKFHHAYVKPRLSDANKLERLEWAMKHVNPVTLVVNDMYNIVHIEEKWFYMMRDSSHVWLVPGETKRGHN